MTSGEVVGYSPDLTIQVKSVVAPRVPSSVVVLVSVDACVPVLGVFTVPSLTVYWSNVPPLLLLKSSSALFFQVTETCCVIPVIEQVNTASVAVATFLSVAVTSVNVNLLFY